MWYYTHMAIDLQLEGLTLIMLLQSVASIVSVLSFGVRNCLEMKRCTFLSIRKFLNEGLQLGILMLIFLNFQVML